MAVLLGLLWPCAIASSAVPTATVSGYARSFISDNRIGGATIVATGTLGTQPVHTTTNVSGRFDFEWPVGETILSVAMSAPGYHTTSGATVVVQPSGFQGKFNEYTFQTPRVVTYDFLKTVLPGTLNTSACHVVTTVTPANITLEDDPQGEPGTVTTLYSGSEVMDIKAFYFGIIGNTTTNPFSRGLNSTSFDGGVIFFNVPPRLEPYTIVATKKGLVFSNASVWCQPGLLINVAPPLGPHVIASA